MQCEEAIELISARVDGELAPEDARRLEAHLAVCAECRATAEAMSLQDAQLVRAFTPRREAASKVAGTVVAAQSRVARPGWTRWWVPIGAAAAGFALAVVVMHARNNSALPTPGSIAPTIAQLDIATGPVECMRPEDSSWQRLATGGALPAGSRVRTGPGVRCEFAMSDGSEVRLNENTELELSQTRSVAVADGQVFSSVAKNAAAPFKVAIGGAMITALGTRFDVHRETDKVILAVLEGSTQLSEGSSPERVVNQGEAVSFSRGTVTPIEASAALDQASRWIMDIVVLKGRDNPELNARVNDLIAQIGENKMAFLRENELKALGDRCVVPLTKYLQSPRSVGEQFKCQEAARVISDVAQPWCIPYLIELLSNPDGEVRAAAASALQRLTNQTQGRTVEQWRDQPTDAGAEAVKKWQHWWEQNKDRYPGSSHTEPSRAPATQMKT